MREEDIERIPANFFVDWYRDKGRLFPWRSSKVTPYQILVTEILLRQTQACSVFKIWDGFFERYSSFQNLIEGSDQDLYDYIKILGLAHQRTSALKEAASFVCTNYNSVVPNSLADLNSIPHIGRYSSNAILCFAFGQAVPIVDTNVLRLVSRYWGIECASDIRRSPRAWDVSRQLIERTTNPIDHNYGVLDFTAEVCKARKASCHICPNAHTCIYFGGVFQAG